MHDEQCAGVVNLRPSTGLQEIRDTDLGVRNFQGYIVTLEVPYKQVRASRSALAALEAPH